MSAQTGYKKKLIAASELQKESKNKLFELISLLYEVFEDREWRADIGNLDDFAAAEMLDKYLVDTSINFLEGKEILERFPHRTQWEKMSLRDLYEQAMEDSNKEQPEPPERHRRSVTMKQYEEVQNEAKDFAARNCFLEREKTEVVSRMKELEHENRHLIAENARLEGRIVELERFVNRTQAVGAK